MAGLYVRVWVPEAGSSHPLLNGDASHLPSVFPALSKEAPQQSGCPGPGLQWWQDLPTVRREEQAWSQGFVGTGEGSMEYEQGFLGGEDQKAAECQD